MGVIESDTVTVTVDATEFVPGLNWAIIRANRGGANLPDVVVRFRKAACLQPYDLAVYGLPAAQREMIAEAVREIARAIDSLSGAVDIMTAEVKIGIMARP